MNNGTFLITEEQLGRYQVVLCSLGSNRPLQYCHTLLQKTLLAPMTTAQLLDSDQKSSHCLHLLESQQGGGSDASVLQPQKRLHSANTMAD